MTYEQLLKVWPFNTLDTLEEINGGDVVEWLPELKATLLTLKASHEELLNQLYLALPYVEEALNDPNYDKGAVQKRIEAIRVVLALAEGS